MRLNQEYEESKSSQYDADYGDTVDDDENG